MECKIWVLLKYFGLLGVILIPIFLLNQYISENQTTFLADETVRALGIDSQDRVWVRTIDGVSMIDKTGVSSYALNSQFLIISRDFAVIRIDDEDRPWVIASTGVREDPIGLYRFDGAEWKLERPLPYSWPASFEELLPCCEQVEDNETGFLPYLPLIKTGGTVYFARDHWEKVWAGTQSGLVRFSAGFHPPFFLLGYVY